MDRELIIKLLTGIIAKTLRHVITAVGGTAALTSVDNSGVDLLQLSGGIVGLAVSVVWSVWDDRMKKKAAEQTVAKAAVSGNKTEFIPRVPAPNGVP